MSSTAITEPVAADPQSDATPNESAPAAGESRPFDSLDAMRDEHTRMLKVFCATGATPEMIVQAKAFLDRGSRTGVNLDRADERLEAQRILDQWSTVLMKTLHEEFDATLAEFEGEDLSGKPCPYVGLKPFGEEDCGFFFGRERLRKQAVAILAEQRFLAILGPSGSGKSSLVLGGIMPDLHNDALPGSGTWLYVPPMVPGPQPLESLVAAFRACPGLLPDGFDAVQLMNTPDRLAQILREKMPERPAILAIDQFEETFTLCEDTMVREVFAKSLLALLDDSQAAHRVILTMRSDFEPRLASVPELQARFIENQTVLRATPLTRAELRNAIEEPAKAVGLRFHKEVIEALLKDVGDEIAALPLLQFTLRKLWETKTRDRITLAQYNRLGGAKGALAKSADEFFGNLRPEEQNIAKGILLRMVRLGEGLEVTSARVRRSSLYEMGYARHRIDAVTDKLITSGLVRVTSGARPEDDQIEVAHEAMVRNWQRLVRWLEEDRAALLTRRRLDDKATEWVRLGSGDAGLLDEVQLREAQEWLETADAKALGFHPALPLLVEKSRASIEAAKREKETTQQQLIEQTQQLAEEQRQRAEAESQLATTERARAEEYSRRAEVERQRAEKQAEVGRRLRRIVWLAFAQNIGFVVFLSGILGGKKTEGIGMVGFIIFVLCAIPVIILGVRALAGTQPDPGMRS